MQDPKRIVVLGTGGSGLTAAIAAHDAGAHVQLIEKADKVGGTTAWSGGMVWIPNNHLEAQAGVPDSREEAITYLMSMSHGLIEQHLAEAFVDAGPVMVKHLCEHMPVAFRTIPHFPDYHAESPAERPVAADPWTPHPTRSLNSASGSIASRPRLTTQIQGYPSTTRRSGRPSPNLFLRLNSNAAAQVTSAPAARHSSAGCCVHAWTAASSHAPAPVRSNW
jgi:glycine/D-amino acid oxidase-like deaminating enzyme